LRWKKESIAKEPAGGKGANDFPEFEEYNQ
jgi:hypothetical protein